VFRVSVIIMLKHDNDLLCADFTCNSIRRCGLVCLAFHESDPLALLWCLGSCICSYRYSPQESLALWFVPAFVLLVTRLCLSAWHSTGSIGQLLFNGSPFIGGYWGSIPLYCFFHAIHFASQMGGFEKPATCTCTRECAEAPERSELPGPSLPCRLSLRSVMYNVSFAVYAKLTTRLNQYVTTGLRAWHTLLRWLGYATIASLSPVKEAALTMRLASSVTIEIFNYYKIEETEKKTRI